MSVVIRVHYDGKVFIPDEPVHLPINVPLLMTIRIPSKDEARTPMEQRPADEKAE